jgi:hypothetical protein
MKSWEDRWNALSDEAKDLYLRILALPIEPDGTIVKMRHGETAIDAITRKLEEHDAEQPFDALAPWRRHDA